MTTTQIDTKDLAALIHHARRGADDMARQIIDEIVERTRELNGDEPKDCPACGSGNYMHAVKCPQGN